MYVCIRVYVFKHTCERPCISTHVNVHICVYVCMRNLNGGEIYAMMYACVENNENNE